jgi:hypothetical protein
MNLQYGGSCGSTEYEQWIFCNLYKTQDWLELPWREGKEQSVVHLVRRDASEHRSMRCSVRSGLINNITARCSRNWSWCDNESQGPPSVVGNVTNIRTVTARSNIISNMKIWQCLKSQSNSRKSNPKTHACARAGNLNSAVKLRDDSVL